MPKRPGRKSAAQTPAPKSEQIKGSKKNPKGSAASAKSAQKIALSRKIINTLQKKAKDFNEKYPSKKVSVSTLKAVFRRGAGAFSKSFRPTITGGKPNSRSAWAFARVNKFLDKKAGKAVKKAYVQDDDLLAFGGEISDVFKYSMKRVDTFLDKLSENLTPSKYTDDDDLLYNDGGRPNGGKVQELISDGIVDIKMFDTTNEHSKMYGFDAQNPLFVQSIVVSKEHRGKGIGSKVFEYIVDYAKENKHDLIFGHITQKAEPSIDLIKSILNKSGFNTIEANNDFYKIIDLKYSDGGTTLLAPNGKPSNLTPEQYKLVRTPEFKAWFGDWENDPANASKVVDENGEPLVVYHGTPRGSFNIFIEKGLVGSLLGKGFYFTNDLDKAKSYSERGIGNDPDPHVFEVFLNIRNIYSFKNKLSRDLILKNKTQDSDLSFNDVLIDDEYDEEGFELNKKEILLKKYYSTEDEWDSAEFLSYFIDKSFVLNSLGYDGIVLGNEIVCFSSNQIKLSDGSNTTFDGNNPDIRYAEGGLTAVKLYGTFDAAKDIDDIVRVSKEKNIQANKLSYKEFEQQINEHLPDRDLGFIEMRLAYNELKKEYKNGGKTGEQITCTNCGWSWNTNDSDPADATICHKCGFDTKQKIMKRKATGNCYQAAGDVVVMSVFKQAQENYQGEPFLVHAEVSGQGPLEGVRFGHAWIEDDLFVYDYSNNKEVVLPKELYYRLGEVDVKNPTKYRRYGFGQARAKMLETGNYGCWDIETQFKDGGHVYNDKELLEKWEAGEKIGFSATAHLKSKGLIPRSDGKKKKSMEDGGEALELEKTEIIEPVEAAEDVQEQSKTVQPQYGSYIGWPLLLRMLEFAKEDAKTDMDLHKVIENLQNLPQDRMLNMDDYDAVISGILEPNEDHIKENFYGIEKNLLNAQRNLYLKLSEDINATDGMSKEDWAKAQTMNWAKNLSRMKKEEESEVLVDLKTGQVLGERKNFMIRREMKKGGVVMAEDLKSYNRDKVLREGYEVGTSAYLAKKTGEDWTYVGEIVGYKELGRFKDLYIVTNKGITVPSTQLLETKMLEKYGFKMAEGGIAPTSLDAVDIEKLDAFEKFMFDDLSKRMTKKEALQVIINNVEGDFSQLSEELEKYADYQRLEESYSMQISDEVESLKTMNDYPITLWAENEANDMSAGWEFTDVMQAVDAAKNLGIISDNNNYEIRDTNTGRLLLSRDQILDAVLGHSNPTEFAYGGDIDYEPEVMELEAEAYISDQKNEAKSILYSRRMSKLQKIMYISDQMDIATNNLRQAKDGHEENIWEEILDIWRNTFAQVERNYCERVKAEYKEGGVTSDCGCGKYFADGGLAYGNSHAKGGMPMTVKSTGQEIEIEGGEGVVNKKSMQMTKKITLNGEKMTPCEAVSEINEMGGGVKFKCDDVKEILDKDGNF